MLNALKKKITLEHIVLLFTHLGFRYEKSAE